MISLDNQIAIFADGATGSKPVFHRFDEFGPFIFGADEAFDDGGFAVSFLPFEMEAQRLFAGRESLGGFVIDFKFEVGICGKDNRKRVVGTGFGHFYKDTGDKRQVTISKTCHLSLVSCR